jgi:UTP--glucose-1-phosphate uridylyltransferase
MIRKVIIPAAGLGTRLFPATKEQPKEMLPLFSATSQGNLSVKPVLQTVFEQLYGTGFREFCYVVGRGKRSVEDHFTPDLSYVNFLKVRGKDAQATELESFYEKLRASTIIWINQPEPKGFGNAVLMTEPFVQNEACLVHAGDSLIISKKMDYIKRLLDTYEKFDADATFIMLEIEKPKKYGVIEGDEVETGIFKVKAAIEKPENPPTNFAIMAIYVFHPVIFKALKTIRPGLDGELQLTDAIQKLVSWGLNVYAVKLDKEYTRLDIGTPKEYWEALDLSYRHHIGQ